MYLNSTGMKNILQQLNNLNIALYEDKPIPSTIELSKLVLEQFVKGNTLMIKVFEAAPLSLLALAG